MSKHCHTAKYRRSRAKELANRRTREARQRTIQSREAQRLQQMKGVEEARIRWRLQQLRSDPRFQLYQRLHDVLKTHLEADPLYRLMQLGRAMRATGWWTPIVTSEEPGYFALDKGDE